MHDFRTGVLSFVGLPLLPNTIDASTLPELRAAWKRQLILTFESFLYHHAKAKTYSMNSCCHVQQIYAEACSIHQP